MASVGSAPEQVVICGGGVIGAAVAYFLSLRGVAATIVERAEIACAASGDSDSAQASCNGSRFLMTGISTAKCSSRMLHGGCAECRAM
jgi:glycine/D-amino acid oxidase-like deaminating enzyme